VNARERREIYLRRGERISDLIREGYIRFEIHQGGKVNPKPPVNSPIVSDPAAVDASKDQI
jgi:hypothetical protein